MGNIFFIFYSMLNTDDNLIKSLENCSLDDKMEEPELKPNEIYED